MYEYNYFLKNYKICKGVKLMGKWDKYKKNKPEKNDSNSLNNGMGKTVINW